MYLESIDLRFIQPCTTHTSRIRIKADLSKDISELLPYINSYIKSCIYNNKAKNITFTHDGKIITIFKDSITITKLVNETDAYECMDYIRDMINHVNNNKENLNPSYEANKLPSPIELYKLLPKLNCKKCGEATCMSFASKLLNGQSNIKKCIPIRESYNTSNLEKLEDIILMIGYEI
ncbi:MAG: (Fe-S)-binding protein [Romboutsia sp.]